MVRVRLGLGLGLGLGSGLGAVEFQDISSSQKKVVMQSDFNNAGLSSDNQRQHVYGLTK